MATRLSHVPQAFIWYMTLPIFPRREDRYPTAPLLGSGWASDSLVTNGVQQKWDCVRKGCPPVTWDGPFGTLSHYAEQPYYEEEQAIQKVFMSTGPCSWDPSQPPALTYRWTFEWISLQMIQPQAFISTPTTESSQLRPLTLRSRNKPSLLYRICIPHS